MSNKVTVQGQTWVYMLLCQNDFLYTGIAKDVRKRFRVHLEGRGSRFTRINTPIEIIAARPYENRHAAARAEVALKRLPVFEKYAWAHHWSWHDDQD